MSREEAISAGPAESGVTSAGSGVYPSSSSSSSSDDEGGSSSLMKKYMWDLIFGDSSSEDDEIDDQIEDLMLRAAGASPAVLRKFAAQREEVRARAAAFRRKAAAERKAMRKRMRALRRKRKALRRSTEALRDGREAAARRQKEFTDLLQTDISGYTEEQRAEYYRELDRRSKQVLGSGGGGGKGFGG